MLLWRQCGAAAGQKSWQRIEVPKVCTVAILPAVAWNGRKSIQLLREIMISLMSTNVFRRYQNGGYAMEGDRLGMTWDSYKMSHNG